MEELVAGNAVELEVAGNVAEGTVFGNGEADQELDVAREQGVGQMATVEGVLVGNNPEEEGQPARRAGSEVGMIQSQAKCRHQEVLMALEGGPNQGHHLAVQWVE